MTQHWRGQTGYDPTWRSFKGKTVFTPHPSSLPAVQELAWPHAYVPVGPPRPEDVDEPAAANAREPLPPAVAPAHPDFEPAVPPLEDTAVPVPPPIPTAPASKLATLYSKTEPLMPPRSERLARPWAARPAGMASIGAGVVLAAALFVAAPKMLATPPALQTMFTAPMLVLRAAGPGEITAVAVSIGQPVDPSTVLLTIHATPAGGSGAVEQPVLAGVRGIVWSLDAQAGAKLRAGDPLAQLADCGRAFLVMQEAPPELRAGQTVLIRMAGVRPFHGTVRPSAGMAEPPNALVIDPTGFNAASPNACPVGATAEIQPETPG